MFARFAHAGISNQQDLEQEVVALAPSPHQKQGSVALLKIQTHPLSSHRGTFWILADSSTLCRKKVGVLLNFEQAEAIFGMIKRDKKKYGWLQKTSWVCCKPPNSIDRDARPAFTAPWIRKRKTYCDCCILDPRHGQRALNAA